MPRLEKICTGTAFCSTFSSTMRSSSSPASRRAFIFSRVRCRRSFSSSFSGSQLLDLGRSRSSRRSVTRSLACVSTRCALLLADHADGDLGQVADHALHVAAVVADLGVLGGLDLEERGADELGQPAGDLGLADAGRPDHDDVLGRDVLAQLGRQLLAAPAVANGHGHGPLGRVLADDVAVQLLTRSGAASCQPRLPPKVHRRDSEVQWTRAVADYEPSSSFVPLYSVLTELSYNSSTSIFRLV